jgi:hypothetical protein
MEYLALRAPAEDEPEAPAEEAPAALVEDEPAALVEEAPAAPVEEEDDDENEEGEEDEETALAVALFFGLNLSVGSLYAITKHSNNASIDVSAAVCPFWILRKENSTVVSRAFSSASGKSNAAARFVMAVVTTLPVKLAAKSESWTTFK